MGAEPKARGREAGKGLRDLSELRRSIDDLAAKAVEKAFPPPHIDIAAQVLAALTHIVDAGVGLLAPFWVGGTAGRLVLLAHAGCDPRTAHRLIGVGDGPTPRRRLAELDGTWHAVPVPLPGDEAEGLLVVGRRLTTQDQERLEPLARDLGAAMVHARRELAIRRARVLEEERLADTRRSERIAAVFAHL